MSVYKHTSSGRWVYDFWFQKQRHLSPFGFDTRAEAEDAEQTLRRKLQRRAAGLEAEGAADTPRFTDWAAVTLRWQRDRKGIKRPDVAKQTLRMVLAFWGERPRQDPVEGGEYRNLRLGHPIENPELITAFEAWMQARHLSGARKNHYRSACSMLYRVALLPEHRRLAGVRENPFMGVLRDRPRRRTAVPELEDIVRWMESAPLPVSIGIGLGLLSPALRLENVVELRRDQISRDLTVLTVPHKTDRATGMPLVVPISRGLRRVLKSVYQRFPDDPYVVPLQGERYWQFGKLVKRSIVDAGLPYGRSTPNGLTFHSLRHAASTWLTRWKVSAAERQLAMNHLTPAMAEWYSHLVGIDMEPTMRMLDERTPIAKNLTRRLKAPTPDDMPKRRTRSSGPDAERKRARDSNGTSRRGRRFSEEN